MKKQNKQQYLVSAALSAIILLFVTISTITVNADISESSDNNIASEVAAITALKSNALQQYADETYTDVSVPADYHVLFVNCRNVTKNGVNYTLSSNSTKEKVFFAAVENFENSVESFAKYNVNIVTEIKDITDTITLSSSDYYITYDIIKEYLADLAPAGHYDSVLVTSAIPENLTIRGVASYSAFNDVTRYGYAYISLVESDTSEINKSHEVSYPYLITTNVAIHE